LANVLNEPVLVDTGPLVAYFNRRHAHHRRCATLLTELAPPLYTCWPVLTEACYRLASHGGSRLAARLLDSCGEGFLAILPLNAIDAHAVAAFLVMYQDQNADLADAAIIHLAERESIDRVFTLDVTDFSIYRTASGKSLTILPPPTAP
jgi:predicted nucleic acid-binding protein